MPGFELLGLREEILRAISELGYDTPMPVQEKVIPFILNEQRDVVALAQTGTGKTAAFGLPMLNMIDTTNPGTQLLVLCPTRELCMQIAEDLNDYSRYLDGVRALAVYGGSSIRNQINMLQKGVKVVVATPGRLLDLIHRNCVDLSNVRCIVMDEADEMLNMGFLDDIDAILEQAPAERRTCLFSATMPEEVERIASKYMREPEEIVIGRKNESTSTVRHIYYTVHSKDKYNALKRIIDFYPRIYGIIFCRTKVETQEVANHLIRDGYSADSLHGDLSQGQRDYVMQRFRLHGLQLLVATDVAARGLDVDDLTHVINYTLPDETEIYTHRSGRTGRAGKTGISIAITNTRDARRIRDIERITGKTFEQGKVPSGKDICNKQIFNLVDRIENAEVNEDQLAEVFPQVLGRMSWLTKEELVKRLMALEFNRILTYYDENEDVQDAESTQGKGRRVEVAQAEAGFKKVFVGVGKMDGFLPKGLLGMVNNVVEGGKVSVGRIDLFTRYSLLDVDEARVDEVVAGLNTLRIRGRQLRAGFATEEQINRGKAERERKERPARERKPADKKPFRKDSKKKFKK